MDTRCAFLVLRPLKQKLGKKLSTVAAENIGFRVIADCINRAGINFTFCDENTASMFDIVLISFTSTYDIISFCRIVSNHPDWQKNRRFKTIGGGPGLSNPFSISDYLDYAVFGRAEKFVANIVDDLLRGKPIIHEHVMSVKDANKVSISLGDKLYPYTLGKWKETFFGCPHKCLFCNYSWTRNRIGKSSDYVNTIMSKQQKEIMFKDIKKIRTKTGRIRTAIDGYSERIRFSYGKKISNKMIVENIEHYGSFGGVSTIMLYNITCFPTEAREDIEEFELTLKKAKPENFVVIVLHTTPFRPSNFTPMQCCEVNFRNIRDTKAKIIHKSEKLKAVHSFTPEGPFSHIATILFERFFESNRFATARDFVIENIYKNQIEKACEFRKMFPDVFEKIMGQYKLSDHPMSIVDGPYKSKILTTA